MKKSIVWVLGLALILATGGRLSAQGNVTINGAGASFPYPIYAQWAYKYNQLTGVKVNYQSIGSGGGIQQIKAKTVDFGASDAPLKAEELEQAGLIQFPMVLGGVVPIMNVKGIQAGQLTLNGPTLAKIFLGSITQWNDPAIQALNPNVKLPDRPIQVVHRSDGSGTTWIFTTYLAAVSPEWKEKVGANKAVAWPVGSGGKGNEGVSAYVQQLDGSIGYVEYAYALQNKMAHVALLNADGKVVQPTQETFAAAAASADWVNAPGYYVVLVNEPGETSWPITGATFILIHKQIADPQVGKAMLNFFDWSYKNGDDMAKSLDYVPLPDNVVELVEKTWSSQVTANGKPLWP
ncbi:MAG: phosphate ABC transporter substrate-binding protein PstS [Candidatus Zixiibacteriota bacterium]|nr:MAG: phosphate ABC transporter substrate-binding protein PstS [candidate division Zixibacteria bacterium]